jgi:hypothetical protein
MRTVPQRQMNPPVTTTANAHADAQTNPMSATLRATRRAVMTAIAA